MNSNKKMSFKTRIKTSSPRLLNSWLFFVTTLVIVLAILFYSFVYVKNNEKEQIAKRFRVLAQIGKNIVEKEIGFRKIAENMVERVMEKSGQFPFPLNDLEDEIRNAKIILKTCEKK